VKYGSLLTEIFGRPGGEALRHRIDGMANEEYQRLLRSDATELRDRVPGDGPGRAEIRRVLAELDDEELVTAIRDLGGHDLGALVRAYREADTVSDRPSVVFAYTVKGWRLPIQGHPGNHSALLRTRQWEELGRELGADPADPWRPFDEGSREARLCVEAAERLRREERRMRPVPAIPRDLGRNHHGMASTQQAFGRFFSDLAREAPEVSGHVVTVSPDVASSTNLGGWINRVGIWSARERFDWFADDAERLVKWREGMRGQHIELGIAEMNMTGLLAELGLTWARDGQPLLPVGTLYDPFVTRTLEPWAFGLYAGGQSILVGTPSGVTLAPEGGAHQSVITPSIGLEQPACIAWEPAFGQEVEWTFLDALGKLGRPGGTSAYFRLSTRPIEQEVAAIPEDGEGREERRRHVLAGGYRLRASVSSPRVTLVGVGAILPEVIAAAEELEEGGVPTDVLCLTSPDLVFRALRARQGFGTEDTAVLDVLFPADRASPLVTVHDGHPHTLAFLGAVRAVPIVSLGVTGFGQSGDLKDLYRHFGLDADTIAGAALDLVDA
jgi:pyruvate dehydrogenase E1 component